MSSGATKDRDTWAHPLWPYEKVRWEELTPKLRENVRLRALGQMDSAQRTLADAQEVLAYLDRKEAETYV